MPSDPISITLVYEDILQRVVLEKVLSGYLAKKYHISNYLPGRGFGWIKTNINAFNIAAANATYVVLVDLDRDTCPIDKIQCWLTNPQNENLIFRIAVNEIESWIVGDTKNFSKFLHLRENRLKKNVDRIADPKKYIFNLVAESNFNQLKGICPKSGARIGPDYNDKLKKFVESSWDPKRAMANSPSLKRAVKRLNEYSPSYSN
jgi:hypothetical protein